MPQTPAQRIAEARDALDLALEYVREAIVSLDGPPAAEWHGASAEHQSERRRLIFLTHSLYAKLAGGRLPPGRRGLLDPALERKYAEREREDQDQEQAIPGAESSTEQAPREG